MFDAIIGLMVFIGGLAFAFLAGGHKQRTKADTEAENLRKATEERIKHAIDFANDDDWRGKLHERK